MMHCKSLGKISIFVVMKSKIAYEKFIAPRKYELGMAATAEDTMTSQSNWTGANIYSIGCNACKEFFRVPQSQSYLQDLPSG